LNLKINAKMDNYEKAYKPVNTYVGQLAAGRHAIQLQDNRPKTLLNPAREINVVQRMPGDFKRIEAQQDKIISVSYEEDSNWTNIVGKISKIKPKSLFIGRKKQFTRDQVNSDGFKILTMPVNEKRSDKDIDFHRPPKPWSDTDDLNKLNIPGSSDFKEKREMVKMIQEVVALAKTMPADLQKIMPHDDSFNLTPEGQLEWCVNKCKGMTTEELAKTLYTSYFYNPINKYLRGNLPGTVNEKIIALIKNTLKNLEGVIKGTVARKIESERIELQAEWMGNPKKGDELNFPAFTSMLPTGISVNAMAKDIGKGTFGEISELAILKFEGNSKILVPNPDTKYFPEEKEIVIPPRMKAKVLKVKKITMDIPEENKVTGKVKKRKVSGKEYSLKILDSDKPGPDPVKPGTPPPKRKKK
jgi:hypothetical protein